MSYFSLASYAPSRSPSICSGARTNATGSSVEIDTASSRPGYVE
jgi:hypothetical protein